MRSGGESFLKEEEALLFSERGFFRDVGGKFVFFGVFGSMAPTERKNRFWGFAKWFFLWSVAPPARGAGGIPTSPLCPPWTPYTPFKRPRDTPGPPLYRKGHVLLPLGRQGPYRARHLVWPGASNQSGAATGTHFAWPRYRGTYCCKVALPGGPMPTLQGQSGVGEPGEGSAAP